MSDPEVSLVIAAKNEGDNLVDMIACLLEAENSLSFEIVLVDDGSIDGSGERAARFFGDHPGFRRHRTKGIGVAAARNCGADMARGATLVFLTGIAGARRAGWANFSNHCLTQVSVWLVLPSPTS